MVNSQVTKPQVQEMMLSALSSLRLVLVSMSQDVSWLTLSQLLLMKLDLELTDNSSIQSNSSLVRKTLPTTLLEDTTLLVERSLISAWTESENSLITVLDYKDSLYLMQSEVVLDLVLDLYFWKDFLLTTERNPNLDSLSIHPLRSQLQLLSHTTLSYPLILY